MYLRIQTQNAQIAIDRQEGQLNIQQNQFPMQLKTTDPKIHLTIEEPVIYIDQRQCFAEAGLKNNMEMSRAFSQKGKQAALQGAGRIASEGRAMTNIHKGSIIAKLAEGRSKPKERVVNFDMIPKSRPEVTVVEGKIHSSLQRGTIDIQMGQITPQFDYVPTKLDIYLKQKNNIHIEFIGKHLDTYGG